MNDTAENKKQTALITGATSGIGYELAKVFAMHGYDLLLIARRADRLEKMKQEFAKTYNVSANYIVKDLAESAAPQEIADEIKKSGMVIDVLVNNAGVGVYGSFSHTEREKELNMIKLNINALTDLTKLLLGDMIHRRCGGIINVASTAAFQPGPKMAVYFASKAYVLSFSEALREEVRRYGIVVSCLCPGTTQTEFQKIAATDGILGSLRDDVMMDAHTVAEIAYRGFVRRKAIIIPGSKNKLLIVLQRLLPRSIVRRVVAKLLD